MQAGLHGTAGYLCSTYYGYTYQASSQFALTLTLTLTLTPTLTRTAAYQVSSQLASGARIRGGLRGHA